MQRSSKKLTNQKPISNFEKRKVVIKNLPDDNIDNVREDLLKLLEKDKNRFGPIQDINIMRNFTGKLIAFLVYENRRVHEEVISYYNEILCRLYGSTLVFEPGNSTTSFLKDYPSTSSNGDEFVSSNTSNHSANFRHDESLSSYESSSYSHDASISNSFREKFDVDLKSNCPSEISNTRKDKNLIKSIVVSNVPNKPNIDKEILKELEKDENLFGAIANFEVMAKSKTSRTTSINVRYADQSVHDDVINYYRSLNPCFQGQPLVFKPSFRLTVNPEESALKFVQLMDFNRNCKDHEKRDVAIINLKNVENIVEEVLEEVQKDEELFGPIEMVKVVRSVNRSKYARAFIRYFDRSVHKSVIDYYITKKPSFHDTPIYFVPSLLLIRDDDFIDPTYYENNIGNEVYTSWNHNLIERRKKHTALKSIDSSSISTISENDAETNHSTSFTTVGTQTQFYLDESTQT